MSYLFRVVASAAILLMERKWHSTESSESSVPGNITKAEWRMMYGFMISTPSKPPTSPILLHRILSLCGPAIKFIISATATEQ